MNNIVKTLCSEGIICNDNDFIDKDANLLLRWIVPSVSFCIKILFFTSHLPRLIVAACCLKTSSIIVNHSVKRSYTGNWEQSIQCIRLALI